MNNATGPSLARGTHESGYRHGREMGARGTRRAIALVALIAACGMAVPATGAQRRPASPTVAADPFTLATPPLARGQIELITLSTLPGAVTGGQVLMEVRGLAPGDSLAVRRNGRSVTAAFARTGRGTSRGLVTGLREGRNVISAAVRGARGRREARLAVRNHPITGPVISGPQQEPYVCRTEEADLGPPLDEDCSIGTVVRWYYRSTRDQAFHELADPYAPYPDDTASTVTSDGNRVPFVARVETATINRGITRMAVLDDPAARGRDVPFTPELWNRRLTYAFGESCGVGYHQGVSTPDAVLGGLPRDVGSDTIFSTIYGIADRLGEGDAIAHSTMTSFGVYCNPLVSAETLMMVKEHVIESYGEIDRTVGVGASGGALQQYNAVNNTPGLLDGAITLASFTDVVSTAMSVVDCGLLLDYWRASDLDWSDEQRAAVAGHVTPRICLDWEDLFLSRLDPQRGCSGAVPDEIRYHPETNPRGVRCTLQDATANIWPTDPATGFADRPYDNVGVQYGLRTLNAGQITVNQFLSLNREIGGYDLDGRNQPQRSAMQEETAQVSYRLGGVVGRGALDQTPVIDLATYLDLVPSADIHDVVRPFQVRERLRARGGGGTMSIWRGVSLPADAQQAMETWLDEVNRAPAGSDRTRAIAAARPGAAGDRCIVSAAGSRVDFLDQVVGPFGAEAALPGPQSSGGLPVGVSLRERQEASGPGVCQSTFTARTGTRIVAGGPLADDVIKCSLKPVDPADYAVPVTESQLAELRRIFPDGVCDWSRPGVGEVERSMQWPSIGGERPTAPRELRWTAARSR